MSRTTSAASLVLVLASKARVAPIGEDAPPRKRWGATTISSFGDDDFRFQPAPSQTCNGDSGGPALAQLAPDARPDGEQRPAALCGRRRRLEGGVRPCRATGCSGGSAG